MTELFKGKYRVSTARADWHRYDHGVYFVTICTKDMRHWFGEIRGGVMHYSPIGRMAHDNLAAMPSHFPYVNIGAFVIMPNHLHMIVFIDSNKLPAGRDVTRHVSNNTIVAGRDVTRHVSNNTIVAKETCHVTSLQQRLIDFATQNKSWLSVIVGQYKQSVTRYAKSHGLPFAWQTRFYDHIVRDQQSYETITRYIENNVETWEIDKMYT